MDKLMNIALNIRTYDYIEHTTVNVLFSCKRNMQKQQLEMFFKKKFS